MASENIREDTDKPLGPGMILLDPNDGRPQVWTVVSKTTARKAKLVAHYGTCHAEATLHENALPEGWAILANALVARLTPRAIVWSGPPRELSASEAVEYARQVKVAVAAVAAAWEDPRLR